MSEEEKKVSLFELLSKMTEVDDGLLNLDLDELEKLGEDTANKVDAYKIVSDRYKARIEELKKQADEITAHKAAISNRHDRFMEKLAQTIDQFGYTKISGHKFRLVTRESEFVQLNEPEENLDYDDWLCFEPYMRRSYAWNKKDILATLRKGYPLPFASLGKRKTVHFDIKKD